MGRSLLLDCREEQNTVKFTSRMSVAFNGSLFLFIHWSVMRPDRQVRWSAIVSASLCEFHSKCGLDMLCVHLRQTSLGTLHGV